MDGPQNSKRIPLATNFTYRGQTNVVGAHIKNGYVDDSESVLRVKKRNGVNPAAWAYNYTTSNEKVARQFYWFTGSGLVGPKSGLVYSYNSGASPAGSLTVISIEALGVANAYNLPSLTYNQTFVEISPSCTNTNKFVVLANNSDTQYQGARLHKVVYDGSIVSVSPAPLAFNMPFVSLAMLKNTLFALTQDGRVYNSAVGDDTTWNAAWYTVANTYNDRAVRIVPHSGQLIMFKFNSVEVFYYAGNPTGSVLAHVESATQAIGLRSFNEITVLGDTIYFVANDRGRSYIAMMRSGSVQIERISTFAVERFINRVGSYFYVFAYPLPTGRKVVVFYASGDSVVYDPDLKLWYYWVFPSLDLVAMSDLSYNGPNPDHGFITQNGVTYTVDVSNDTYGTSIDAGGSVIALEVTTPNIDMDTRFKKFQSQAVVVGEYGPGTVTVDFTDDDYNTFVSAGSVSMADVLPYTPKLGVFRKRAFRLTHASNAPCVLSALELTVEGGSV